MRNEIPKVSIVTPSFNQAAYLEQTILSVLEQDYQNIEYIVIDGGSTDGSLDIIKKYQSRLAYWVSESDNGQSHAINKGFSHATGDIFNWLCSDDILMPSATKIAVNYLGKNPELGVVYGDRIRIDGKGNFLCCEKQPPFKAKLLKYVYRIPTETGFIRKKHWNAVGGVNEKMHFCMDYDIWIRLNTITSFRHIPFVMGAYREHALAKSITAEDGTRAKWKEEINCTVERYYSSKRNRYFRKWCKRYMRFNGWFERRKKNYRDEVAEIKAIISAEEI